MLIQYTLLSLSTHAIPHSTSDLAFFSKTAQEAGPTPLRLPNGGDLTTVCHHAQLREHHAFLARAAYQALRSPREAATVRTGSATGTRNSRG